MEHPMAKLRLKYVNEYLDSTGKMRRYFRRGGKQLGPIPGEVGSEEFMEAYQAYLSAQPVKPKSSAHPGSVAAWIEDFYADRMFKDLELSTRAAYRAALEPIAKDYGNRDAAALTTEK